MGDAARHNLTAPSAGRSRNMRAIKRVNTGPEVSLRSLLHGKGLRFRKDLLIRLGAGVKVRPDVVLTRLRIAIFYDSCFWHSCALHGRQPQVNESYWTPKLARTVERDRDQTAALEAEGWIVVRIWEHETLPEAVQRIFELVKVRKESMGFGSRTLPYSSR